MHRNIFVYFFVMFAAMIVFAPFLHAQDLDASAEQGSSVPTFRRDEISPSGGPLRSPASLFELRRDLTEAEHESNSAKVDPSSIDFATAEQGEYDLTVDEALDQFEENVVQVQNDEVLTETDVDIPDEVEVLKEIVIDEDNKPEEGEILETKIIPLLHAEASSIIDTLNQMKSPKGEVMYNEEDSTLVLKDASEQLEAMSVYVKEVDILLETKIFKLEHAKAGDVVEKVKGILTKNVGQILFDQQVNSIVATDTPLKIGKIGELILSLDFVNMEIQIETKILQIVLNDEHTMGVDWEAIVSDFQSIDFAGFTFEEDLQEARKLKVGAVSQEDYEILLEALDTVGVVHGVSDDVTKTEYESTKTIRILSSLSREIQKSKSNPTDEDNAFVGEMVQFHLTPIVDHDETITVSIQPEYIGKKFSDSSEPSSTSASIKIENGETIVIGSLFEEVMVESSWKVPLLGDLPLLGFVFRNQGEQPRKSEIITFLTIKAIEKEK